MDKKKVNFYIDGFNLYHSAFKKHYSFVKGSHKLVGWEYLRWQNLKKLMSLFINDKTEILGDIYYFTALAKWIPEKAAKHSRYITALKNEGINVVEGRFKEKNKRCPLCKKDFISHEEKESDVNIAIYFLSDLMQNKCDTACIVTGDSDMIPSLKMSKKLCPNKKIGLILPPYQLGADLKSEVHFVKKIKKDMLKKSLFPKEIIIDGIKIQAPDNWLPKDYK